MREWRYSSTILGIGTRCEVSFTPRLLYSWGKELTVSMEKRLDGSHSRSGHCGEKKNPLPQPRNEVIKSAVLHIVADRYPVVR
jgi:hypothetical protein